LVSSEVENRFTTKDTKDTKGAKLEGKTAQT